MLPSGRRKSAFHVRNMPTDGTLVFYDIWKLIYRFYCSAALGRVTRARRVHLAHNARRGWNSGPIDLVPSIEARGLDAVSAKSKYETVC